MQQWSIWWRSPEMYPTRAELVTQDIPWWAIGMTHFVQWLDTVVLRYNWCSPPEWTFKIPTKSFERDEDGLLEHSIGGAIFHSFQVLSGWDCWYARNRRSIDLTDQWLDKYGLTYPWGDLDEDEA